MKPLNEHITDFLFNLSFSAALPAGFQLLNPFTGEDTRRAAGSFYQKFYHDTKSRHCIVGINPGRFGAGITGVPFTDPIRLHVECGIENDWVKRQELSSVFIYDVINAFGGVEKFYHQFYITAVSPLGFTRDGKNINYYDNKQLHESVIPFAVECLRRQLSWGLQKDVAYCLGEGKNYRCLVQLNEQYQLFDAIVPLPHPRFIMQYRLKQKDAYKELYLKQLSRL